MKHKLLPVILTTLMTAGAHAAVTYSLTGIAAPTLGTFDTGYTGASNSEFGWDNTETFGQTFTVAAGRKLDAIYFAADKFGNGDTLTLTLTVGTGGTPGAVGTNIFTQTGLVMTGTATTDNTTVRWYKFDFSGENVSLATGLNYFSFLATAEFDGPDTNTYGLAPKYSSSNPYAGGQASGIAGGFPTNDMLFAVTTVPEPASALLGGIGLLALLRRRR